MGVKNPTPHNHHLSPSPAPRAAVDSHYSPLRYPGGKRQLLTQTRAWLSSRPRTPHLIEGFAGGAGVGLTALCTGLISGLTLVELDADVAHFWATVFSPAGYELAQAVRGVAQQFAHAFIASGPPPDPIGRALHLLVLNRLRHNGILTPGAGLISTTRPPNDFRYNPENLAKRIVLLADLADCVEVIHGSALDVLAAHRCNRDTVFYLDPPYSLAGGPGKRLYRHWQLDHDRLFALAGSVEGDVLISHHDHPRTRALARANGFRAAVVEVNTKRGRAPELLAARTFGWLAPSRDVPVRVLDSMPFARMASVGISPLLTFLAVAEELHLTRAAVRLGISVSAVSRRITELEGKLGAALLARSTHGVQLTLDGAKLRERLEPALLALDGALEPAA